MKSITLIRIIIISLIFLIFGSWMFFLETNTLELSNQKIELDISSKTNINEYMIEENKLYYFTSSTAYFKIDETLEDDNKIVIETSYYSEFGEVALVNSESKYRNYVYENYYYDFIKKADTTIYSYLYNDIIDDLSQRMISNYDRIIYPLITIRVSERNKDLIITDERGN